MSRFKVGDKVRYKRNESLWYNDTIRDGAEGEVVGRGLLDNEVLVCFPNAASNIPIGNLELVPPTDPKREFLERLQSLMREFDAEIVFSCNHTYKTIKTTITIGDTNIVRNEVYGVCADNIMDFDEE